jgi:hypothetical protein
LTQEIKQCTYAAFVYNKAGELLKTMALADFCHVAIDHTKRFGQFVYGCAEAIPLGCYDGFANFGTFLGSLYENPQQVLGEMAQGVGQLTGCLINVIDAFGPDSPGLDDGWITPQHNRDMETVAIYTGVLAKAIGEKVAATPTRTLIRQSVACITEGLLFNQCLCAIGSACKKTATTAATLSKVMKNAGYAAEVTAEVLEPIAAGIGEVEGLSSKTGMLFNEIEGQAKNIGTVESQLGKVVEQETKQLATQVAECPASCPKQYENLKSALQVEELASTKSIGNTQKIEFTFKELCVEKKLLEATTREIALSKLEKIGVQLPNKLKETIKDATAKFQDFNVFVDANKNYIVSMTKPGNVPGSKAIYYKVVDPVGKTLEVFKDTFDNLGKFVHRKYKTLL